MYIQIVVMKLVCSVRYKTRPGLSYHKTHSHPEFYGPGITNRIKDLKSSSKDRLTSASADVDIDSTEIEGLKINCAVGQIDIFSLLYLCFWCLLINLMRW